MSTRGLMRQGGGDKRKRQARQPIEARDRPAAIWRSNGLCGGPGRAEEARGRQRALWRLSRLSGRGPRGPVAPLLSSERSSARRFPASVIYEDEVNEEVGVAAALLCARFLFLLRSRCPRARRLPEPRTRCAVGARERGRAGGGVAAGGWRDGGRTGPLWDAALSTAPSLNHRAFSVRRPRPRLSRRVLGCWCCPARLGSQPHRVVCARA